MLIRVKKIEESIYTSLIHRYCHTLPIVAAGEDDDYHFLLLCASLIHIYSSQNRYFRGHCSQEIRDIIPVSLRHVRIAKSSTHSHSFQVSMPTSQTLSHK